MFEQHQVGICTMASTQILHVVVVDAKSKHTATCTLMQVALSMAFPLEANMNHCQA